MSTIVHFFRAGGLVMYPLLVLSLAAIAVIVERALAFRQLGHLAPGLLPKVLQLCREGCADEALRECEKHTGPLAAVLAVILRHRNQPTEEIEREVQETGQEYFLRLEHLLPVLDTTTTVSPLLGLLGTIVGMVGTFNAIAAHQSTGSNDAILSGVGEALYATASGILIAVICFGAYNYFAARVQTISGETEMAATKLLNVIVERRHVESGDLVSARTNHAAHTANTRARLEEQEHGVQAKARA